MIWVGLLLLIVLPATGALLFNRYMKRKESDIDFSWKSPRSPLDRIAMMLHKDNRPGP